MKVLNLLHENIYCGFIFAVVVGSLLMISCMPRQSGEIRIGVLATLSGDPKVIESSGKPTVDAVRLAADEINKAGGLKIRDKTYKIILFIEDDYNNPNETAASVKRLINQHKVAAIIGPQYSKNAIPAAELAESTGIPLISPMSTNPQTTANKKGVFRVGFIDPFQGKVLAQFAYNNLKARKAAVLYNIANDYNRGLAQVFNEEFTKIGGKISSYESYTTDNVNYQTQLKQIRNSQPDVLLLPNYTYEIIPQVEQSRKLGITATLLFGDGFVLSAVSDPSLFEGSFLCGHWHPESSSIKSREFVKTFQKTYDYEAGEASALTYDAFGLVIFAMQNEGKSDSHSIKKGMAKIQGYQGVCGVISYKGSGDPIKSAFISQIIGGKALFYTLVEP